MNADSFSSKVAVSKIIKLTTRKYLIILTQYFLKLALEKEHKKKLQFKFAWSQMPQELRPQASKRKLVKSKAEPHMKKKPKTVEKIEEKLQLLEQKEKDDRDDEKSEKDTDVRKIYLKR